MYRILSIGIDVLASAVFLTPLFLIIRAFDGKRISAWKKILLFLFDLYLAAVFSATGVPTAMNIHLDFSLNLIPLAGLLGDIEEPALNVVLFLPLGILLPVLWKRFRGMKPVLAAGFFLSLGIELLQILTFRLTDVNDLLMNTLGTLLGFLAVEGIGKRFSGRLFFQDEPEGKYEFERAAGIVFLVNFFLTCFLSEMFWSMNTGL